MYMTLTILAAFRQACAKQEEKVLLEKHSRLSSCHSLAISLRMCSSTSPAAAGCSLRYSSLYDPSNPSCASSCKQQNPTNIMQQVEFILIQRVVIVIHLMISPAPICNRYTPTASSSMHYYYIIRK